MLQILSNKSNRCKLMALSLIGIYLSIVSPLSFGAGDRLDYDVDDDGLIEIYDAADFMAIESTYYKGGASLYGESTGCADELCLGYELEADIDLSNQDLNSRLFFLEQIFEGNHHKLTGARKSGGGGEAALFYTFDKSVARNLRLEQVDFSASQYYVGGIAALAQGSQFINISVSGNLTSDHYTGGIVGVGVNVSLVNCHFYGILNPRYVQSTLGMGGLVGFGDTVSIYASSAQAQIVSFDAPVNFAAVGGLVGVPYKLINISSSFADVTNLLDNNVAGIVPYSTESAIVDSYVIARNGQGEVQRIIVFDHVADVAINDPIKPSNKEIPFEDLTCPKSETDIRCTEVNLFSGWDRHQDSNGNSVWNWGSETDAPTHKMDLDFDGVDGDGDGVLDVVDDFPLNVAVSMDSDQDGLPDRWNPNCDAECQAGSNLQLDTVIERDRIGTTPTAGLLNTWLVLSLLLGICITNPRRN